MINHLLHDVYLEYLYCKRQVGEYARNFEMMNFRDTDNLMFLWIKQVMKTRDIMEELMNESGIKRIIIDW